MRTSSRFIVVAPCVFAALAFRTDPAAAQLYQVRPGVRSGVRPGVPSTSAKTKPGKTTVTIDLLAGSQGVGLAAQQWQQTFRKLGYSLRVRRALGSEKPQVKETTLGTLRRVQVIGLLDRSGKIVLPDRSFTRSDAARLGEWLKQLETYGAQGAPDGKPLWGLSKAQFAAVYRDLAVKVPANVDGLPLEDALKKLALPPNCPLRLSAAAASWLRMEFSQVPPFGQSLKGVTKGTALACLLNDYGLGFRPMRTPTGTIELVVEPLTKTTDVWPVGWPLKDSRSKTAPKLFELVPVSFENVKLVDVLHAVSVKTGVPILVDHYRIEAKGIDVETLSVSYKPRKTSWSLLLMGVTTPNRLTRRLKVDEAGTAFVWVTVLQPIRPRD